MGRVPNPLFRSGWKWALAFILVGVAAASLSLGFVLTRWAWPDPNTRLARDLSLAEHLEEYQEVESSQFLDELVKSRLFDGPSP